MLHLPHLSSFRERFSPDTIEGRFNTVRGSFSTKTVWRGRRSDKARRGWRSRCPSGLSRPCTAHCPSPRRGGRATPLRSPCTSTRLRRANRQRGKTYRTYRTAAEAAWTTVSPVARLTRVSVHCSLGANGALPFSGVATATPSVLRSLLVGTAWSPRRTFYACGWRENGL